MKIEAVLKNIRTAINCIQSAKSFSCHDMPESAQEQCAEAIGYLESTKLYLEIESGTFGKEPEVTVQ